MIFLEKPSDFHSAVEVVGCFIEHAGRILLLHRQENKAQGNTWGIPGGKLEPKESPIEAALRETYEETGYQLPADSMLYLRRVFIKHPSFDYIYHMVHCLLPHRPCQVRINFDEHKGFTWVTPQDALSMALMLDEDACIKLVYSLE